MNQHHIESEVMQQRLSLWEVVRQGAVAAARRRQVRVIFSASAAAILALAGAVVVSPDSALGVLVARSVKQNSTPNNMLKVTQMLLTYAGLALPGELAARLTSLLSLCCGNVASLLQWPNVNCPHGEFSFRRVAPSSPVFRLRLSPATLA